MYTIPEIKSFVHSPLFVTVLLSPLSMMGLLSRNVFMCYYKLSEIYLPHRGCILQEFSSGELLTRAPFMHHDDKRYNALKHYAALKVLDRSL